MQIIPVKSSVVAKIGYDADNLFIQFVGGDWYKYSNVPETVFKRFCDADSKGQFLNREIKPKYTNYEPCIFNPVF
ncbi:MAG: KTSC domain-containing protein [Selenomonadaceae bacterium]|nr:KTSC domain-containing protein [Selenomonadaceae bacterium]